MRDFGGIRLHVPTLKKKGVDFSPIPSGSAVMTDKLHNVWSKVHHAVIQNHIGSLLGALGLDDPSGWTIVRDTLSAVLRPEKSAPGKQLYDFFLGDTMPFKCFLRMRMEGKYRDVSCLWNLFLNYTPTDSEPSLSMWRDKSQMCF